VISFELDGRTIEVTEGSTVIEAAHQAGIAIPHFCYHKKLSIAANCRMCLVQVEKAPKPLPACATPVTNGMKVFTHSEMAIAAQKGVMEFMLINHPLDCPICDQGGECDLQDLAVGYGGSRSRYREDKRVVVHKELGALIATDMTRCINCTRCVRFSQEIGGYQELGQAYRGDRAQIMPFLGQTVESELSGNLIDLCPVGALTSKPFRFSARSWEMTRHRAISPHDSLGSHLTVHTRRQQVLRVTPQECETLNECWLSDTDRFSYEALNSSQRLTEPMIKQGGIWHTVDWNVALDYCAHALRDITGKHGGDALGALIASHATLEEMYLAGHLVRGLGSGNIDHRHRQQDFSLDHQRAGIPWLGLPVTALNTRDRILLIGSFLRQEHPLIAHRLRQAVKGGARLMTLHASDEDLLVPLAGRHIVKPSQLPHALGALVKAVSLHLGQALPPELSAALAPITPDAQSTALAQALVGNSPKAQTSSYIGLGNYAQQHPQAGLLQQLTQALAQLLDAPWGLLIDGANSLGGSLAGALPDPTGRNSLRMLAEPRQAYLLVGCEPELDSSDGAQALHALGQAASVIALTSFISPAMQDYADALLPLSPFTETSGSFINSEGRIQAFSAACTPRGQTRPGWKILHALGTLLDIPSPLSPDEEPSTDSLRRALLAQHQISAQATHISGCDNTITAPITPSPALEPPTHSGAPSPKALERLADIPAPHSDPIVRRAPALGRTAAARTPTARMNAATLAERNIQAGQTLLCRSPSGDISAQAELDPRLPDGVIRLAGAHPQTLALGPLFTTVQVEPA
jgi:NADH-quinone oxidoreductase subunit G